MYSSLLALTLGIGYKIDPSVYHLDVSRLRLYTIVLFNLVSSFYLILASIDRVLITSTNARIRLRSTRHLAYVCILTGTLYWAFFHSHALIFSSISRITPNVLLCYYHQGSHLTFMGYCSLLKKTTVASLMIFCRVLSLKRIQTVRLVRNTPYLSASGTSMASSSRTTSSRDRQFSVMLLMDTTLYTVFSFSFAIFLMYQQIIQNQFKSPQQSEIEVIIRNLCLFSAGILFCSGSYTKLLMSKMFRSAAKKPFSQKQTCSVCTGFA